MKKLLCLLVAVAAIATASAQQKGDKYLGGSLGVAVTSTIVEGESATGFGLSFAPEFSYFVADNLRVGASINYGFETIDRTSPIAHALTVMPEAAYYVKIIDKLYYTPTFQFGFACSIMGKTELTESIAMPGFGIGLQLGAFEFRPSPKFGVSLSLLNLEYIFTRYKEDFIDYKHNSIGFRLGGSSSIGVRYYF